MPLLAIFGTTAQIGLGVDATVLKPYKAVGRKRGRKRDIKTAVAVEVYGVAAVAFQAFLISEEHGDFGAVGGSVEHLLGNIVGGIEILYFRLGEQTAFACGLVEYIDARRIEERCEIVEYFVGLGRRGDADRAVSGKFDVADFVAVERIDSRIYGCILLIRQDKIVAAARYAGKHSFLLGDDNLPVGAHGIG